MIIQIMTDDIQMISKIHEENPIVLITQSKGANKRKHERLGAELRIRVPIWP